MEEIGKILPAVFKRQVRRADAPLVELLAPLWARVAGKAMAEHSCPVAFAEGTLTLAVSCPSWTAQLRMMSEDIRAKINSFLGGPIVRTLRVRHVPDFHPMETRPAKQEDLADPRTGTLGQPVGAANLDPEISGILERSFAKYFARSGKRAD
ncbi:MAG: DUF721 domain-containing protein [Acidobacteria bacterium]|nr:DUF721 domain-containing protein [Acidobacteriota bacterium]